MLTFEEFEQKIDRLNFYAENIMTETFKTDMNEAFTDYLKDEKIFVQKLCEYIYPLNPILENKFSRIQYYSSYNTNIQITLLKRLIVDNIILFDDKNRSRYHDRTYTSIETIDDLLSVLNEMILADEGGEFKTIYDVFSESFIKQAKLGITFNKGEIKPQDVSIISNDNIWDNAFDIIETSFKYNIEYLNKLEDIINGKIQISMFEEIRLKYSKLHDILDEKYLKFKQQIENSQSIKELEHF